MTNVCFDGFFVILTFHLPSNLLAARTEGSNATTKRFDPAKERLIWRIWRIFYCVKRARALIWRIGLKTTSRCVKLRLVA